MTPPEIAAAVALSALTAAVVFWHVGAAIDAREPHAWDPGRLIALFVLTVWGVVVFVVALILAGVLAITEARP